MALIAGLDAELEANYPDPADRFTEFGPDEGEGAMFVARLDGVAIGCIGVRVRAPGVAELKRMYVAPSARGHGVGRALVAAVEAEAVRLGATRVVLETGDLQVAAMALYRAVGFEPIPCFDEYAHAPLSVCLGKDL